MDKMSFRELNRSFYLVGESDVPMAANYHSKSCVRILKAPISMLTYEETLRRVVTSRNMKKKEPHTLLETWYIYFNVAEYISKLIGPFYSVRGSADVCKNTSKDRNPINILRELADGVYDVHMSTPVEHHQFVLAVQDTTFHVMNGYGGYHGDPCVVEMEKVSWIERFEDAFTSDTPAGCYSEIMKYLFALLEENVDNAHPCSRTRNLPCKLEKLEIYRADCVFVL